MTTLINIPTAAHAEIMETLQIVEAQNNVRILFAIESGSRAWGFPSPDSDYDVRFVYVRQRDWYLTIEPGRDVIELPLYNDFEGIKNYEHDLDINGWDLKKALGLLLKPNPVLLEWLSSPVKYMWNDAACDALIKLAEKAAFGPACLHHYLNLGRRQWSAYVSDRAQVNLKKYFYIVRPAMAIRWIRINPSKIPPMNFFDLKAGIDLPTDLSSELDILLEKKSKTKELGEELRIPSIDKFIMDEFFWAAEAVKNLPKGKTELTPEANNLFRQWVH